MQLAADRYAAGLRQPPHDHDALQISLVLRGAVEERVGGVVALGRALSVVVKDPGVRHRNTFGARGAFMARISVAGTALAQLIDRGERAREWCWHHDPLVATPFLRLLARREYWLAADDADVVDLLATLTAAPHRTAGEPPEWLTRTVSEIADRWNVIESVGEIAQRAGVHPVYLARCIRRWYGRSTADLVRQARVCGAAELLVNGDATISMVAHEVGFADEAHLNRSLRAATGMTPARLRRVVHAFADGLPRSILVRNRASALG